MQVNLTKRDQHGHIPIKNVGAIFSSDSFRFAVMTKTTFLGGGCVVLSTLFCAILVTRVNAALNKVDICRLDCFLNVY